MLILTFKTRKQSEPIKNTFIRILFKYTIAFLNDILKELGMDPVPWGQLAGWLRGNPDGDGYVEIIADDQRAALVCDNDTACKPIYLEFNCDGQIWSRI